MSEEEKVIMERPDYENELISIIQSDESADVIRERLGDYHDNDIAEVLQRLDKVFSGFGRRVTPVKEAMHINL